MKVKNKSSVLTNATNCKIWKHFFTMNRETPATDKLLIDSYNVKNRLV